jgi:hypothetical protein
MRCAVIGAGAWGTALADLLASNGNEAVIWAHEPDVAQSINECHENRRFLAGQSLAASLRATNDQALRSTGRRWWSTPRRRSTCGVSLVTARDMSTREPSSPSRARAWSMEHSR